MNDIFIKAQAMGASSKASSEFRRCRSERFNSNALLLCGHEVAHVPFSRLYRTIGRRPALKNKCYAVGRTETLRLR